MAKLVKLRCTCTHLPDDHWPEGLCKVCNCIEWDVDGSDETYRWYCYAEDQLMDCMGRRPQMYDPISEWDDEHNACGFVIVTPTEPGQPIQEDWEERLGGASNN